MLPPYATSHAKARRTGFVSTNNRRSFFNPLLVLRLILFGIGLLLLAQIYSRFPFFTAWVFGSSNTSSSSSSSSSSVIYYNQQLQSDTATAASIGEATKRGNPVELRSVLRKIQLGISSEKKQKKGAPLQTPSSGETIISAPRDEAPKNEQVLGKPVNWAEKIVPKSWKMFSKQLPESEDARLQRQRNEDEMRAKKELAEEELRSRAEAIRVADRKRQRQEAQRLKMIELEAAEAAEKRGKLLQSVLTEEDGKAIKEKASLEKKAREEEEKKSFLAQKVLDAENALKASVEQKKARIAQRAKEAELARQAAIEAAAKADQAEKDAAFALQEEEQKEGGGGAEDEKKIVDNVS
jgi:hypothetical protein